ncbi:unknown [Clostridium sp. CAG:1013]|nr:unknown [Clostridium sp. CAG:1013]
MLFVSNQQIQLAVLLDLDAQLIQAIDGSVAGEEVLRTGTEGDDLQALDADDGASDGNELSDLVGDLGSVAHRILGDVALQAAQAQVVRAVQHAAVSVATAVDQVAVAFGSSHEHAGTVKVLGNEGLGGLGAKVAQEHGEGVAASSGNFLNGLEHIFLIFHGGLSFVNFQALLGAGSNHSGPTVLGKLDGEAVTGDSDDAQLHLRDVNHFGFLHFFKNSETFCAGQPMTAPHLYAHFSLS